MPHMTQRNRKLIGAFLVVGSIAAWSVLAVLGGLAVNQAFALYQRQRVEERYSFAARMKVVADAYGELLAGRSP